MAVFLQKKSSKAFIAVMLVPVFLSTFICLNYNAPQFIETNPFFWIFISDNTIYPALLILILEYMLLGRNPPEVFKSACCAGLLKYCIFSISLMLAFRDYFFSEIFSGFYYLFFSANVFLVVSSVFIFKLTKRNHSAVPLFLWFLLNDTADFAFNFSPFIPYDAYRIFFAFESITLSVFTSLLLFHPMPEV